MNPSQNKTVIQPDLTDTLVNFKFDIFATLNCVKIGQINSFDGTKKTAQVQLMFKRVFPDGSVQSYPLLVDCPVFTLQGGGGAIQFPIAAGDQCIVLFSDRRIDEWFANGAEAAPADGRMHDLSDGICLVGVNALSSTLPTYPTDKVIISYQGTSFEIDSLGWKFVGDGSAEIDLQGAIVTIKNNTTTLLTLLNNLVSAILALQVQGNLPLTPASITAITAAQTQLATLLG